jgi:MFS transporter, DHA1 family, inner membrane transport protein
MAIDRQMARSVGALAALSVSSFAYVTTEILPIGMLLLMSRDLRSSPSAIGLLVTGYGLVVVVASIPLTQLTRRIPRRLLLSTLLAVFVTATLGSAAAGSYEMLLAARVVTAVSQALFWSIVVPTATSMFPHRMRGRVVSVVFAGASLSAVLGVPAGTWLGQQAGWRTSFFALGLLGLIAMISAARLLPSAPPGQAQVTIGTEPDSRRYWMLIATTILAVTGTFAAFTYITPFLTDVSRFSVAAIGPLLFVRGIAGVVGVSAGGTLVDRVPWWSMVIPVAAQAVALLGLYRFGGNQAAAVALIAVSGISFAIMTTSLSTRVLHVAPVSVELASAGASTAVNVGITAGAFIGSVLLPGFGVRSTALAGGLLSVAALAVVLCEPLLALGVRRYPDPATNL